VLSPELKDRMRLVVSHVMRETGGATGRHFGDRLGGEEGEKD
jgi:hypothetical protein